MLVDDHKLIIQAYTSLLKEIPNFKIVARAYHGKEALELIELTTPDVIIMDSDMPVMNGIEALKVIHAKYPGIKIIILTMHTEIGYASNFLINGAHSFLGKNCDVNELIKAINTVVKEGFYFSSTVSKSIIANTLKDHDFTAEYKLLRLTERETAILKLICEDKSNEQIATHLNITINTIKFFRKSIYEKTNEKSVIGLIKYAIKTGIISIEY